MIIELLHPTFEGLEVAYIATNSGYRLVNEKTQVGLLLAALGVIATLAFVPLAILVLYSSEFGEATELLRWICLGMALRLISWPMEYTILAKGAQSLFFGTELAWTLVNVGLAALLIPRYGVNGAGIAFFGSYVFHVAMIYGASRWLAGFRWTPENGRSAAYFTALVALIFAGFLSIPAWLAYIVGASALIGATVYRLSELVDLVDEDQIPGRLRGLLGYARR